MQKDKVCYTTRANKLYPSSFVLLLFICCVGLAFNTFAAESYNEVPDRPLPEGTPLLTHKRFTTQRKFEIGVFLYDTTVANGYVEHPYATHLSFGYHFADWFAVEAYGGYVPLSYEDSIVNDARQILIRDSKGEPGLPGLWQTEWFTGINLQWAPFYGKLSLVSEADLGFQFYGLLGAGVDGIKLASNDSDSAQRDIRYAVNIGAGLRIFFIDQLALRFEFKNSFGMNPGAGGAVNAQCPEGFVAQNNKGQYCSRDIASTSWVHLGLSIFI